MEDIMPKTEEVKESVGTKEVEESSSGFTNHFLDADKEEKENGHDRDGEKRGGIITHIISNLVSCVSPKAGDFAARDGKIRSVDCDRDLGRSGGGVISNLFHHSEEHGKQSEEEGLEKKASEGSEKKEEKEEENSKGGLIGNIVSYFPTSLPDDAVPTTDEAFILIHSIVKD